MHTDSRTPAIDAIVATARDHARLAARLLRRLDPFRHDPRVAHVSDLCAVLEGPTLLREDSLGAIELLAAEVAEQLVRAAQAGRLDARREALETLHVALLDTVETARALDTVIAADPELDLRRAAG